MQTLPQIPPSLQRLNTIPSTLYAIGNTHLLEQRRIAIVGSRRASAYAKNMTFELAKALKQSGFIVVSGAAMGIDAFAHKGAFPSTIAVMGNSLDLQQPSVNKGLIESIEKEGLCLSEYPPTTHATKYSFVDRNRIVVGLSEAIILSEADEKSGTMHSARFALEMGIPIYVLSHRIGESLGTQALVEEGKAKVITSVEGFLKDLGITQEADSSDDELLAYCKAQPSYDEAVAKFGGKLFEYELMGKVEVVNGRVIVL